MKLEFSRQNFEKIIKQNFMKIRPEGAELFLADGQTDMTKPTVAFRSFAKTTNKCFFHTYVTLVKEAAGS
jgi:hypothetical protein